MTTPPPPFSEPPGSPFGPSFPAPPAVLPAPFGTPDSPRLRVQGEAAVHTGPELATLTVIVTARGRDRRATLDELTRRNDAVLDLVRARGDALDRLDTGSFTVAPEMSERRTEKIRAHQGTVRIQATLTDFDALGELATLLADLGHIRVQGPWWTLRPDSPAHRRAREEAVRCALRRAREYAAALGAELTALLELSDTGAEPGPPVPFRGAALAGGFRSFAAGSDEDAPPLRLEPERQTVFAQVTAHFTMTRPEL